MAATEPRELDLLARLASDAGRAVTRNSLMEDVWDRSWFGSTKTLDVHIAALRRRLVEAASELTPAGQIPEIRPLRSHGYRLETASGDGRSPGGERPQ